MIKIAFASNNETHVNLHFGAAESFVVYDVSPGTAELIGIGRFVSVTMKGENKEKALEPVQQADAAMVVPSSVDYPPHPADKPPEDKVLAKLEFLKDCAAVYAASIGTSSIKRLMMHKIQPIIVNNGHEIVDLLNEVSLALSVGGLAWVDRAKNRSVTPERFDMWDKEGWLGEEQSPPEQVHSLITSVDDDIA